MNRRHAVSLVELLLAMSACTAILTMSAALIHRVLLVQSKARAALDAERAALRLSEQFRLDVHAARAANTPGEGANGDLVLRLNLGQGQAIEYRRAEGKVLRLVLEADAVRGREQFKLPGAMQLTIRDEAPGLVTLSITSPRPDAKAEASEGSETADMGPIDIETTARLNREGDGAALPEETEP